MDRKTRREAREGLAAEMKARPALADADTIQAPRKDDGMGGTERIDEVNPCGQCSGIKARLDNCEDQDRILHGRQDKVEDVIADIRDRLIGRPSWAVCVIIAGLLAMCTMFGTALYRHTGKNPNKDIQDSIKTLIYQMSQVEKKLDGRGE